MVKRVYAMIYVCYQFFISIGCICFAENVRIDVPVMEFG